MSDFSSNSIRRQKIYDSLEFCDNNKSREAILIDRIIQLENSLNELSESYAELLRLFELRCVHPPF